MAVIAKLDRSVKRKHGDSEFGIEILYPGLALKQGDSGIGAIGRIDHARVTPGTVIRMHPHRDDEILTYLRRGSVLHRDTVGHTEQISNQRLMLMGAGHTFQHEETVLPDSGILEGLQIFVRPRARNLEPSVQFHAFDTAVSNDAWRLVAGPSDNAPLRFRANAWIHDNRLTAGTETSIPLPPIKSTVRLLYVFDGHITISGHSLVNGESVLLDNAAHIAVAEEDSDLVLFTTEPSALVYSGGMFSGNILGT